MTGSMRSWVAVAAIFWAFLDRAPCAFCADMGTKSVPTAAAKGAAAKGREGPPAPQTVWDPAGAWRQTSPARETISINGLWQFAPVLGGEAKEPPPQGDEWGWFKVPGIWPAGRGRSAVQKMLQPDGAPSSRNLAALEQAWYRRTIRVPREWTGRRVLLDFTMLQTHARVLVDGKLAGEARFPGGRLEITRLVKPGEEQDLTLLVTARPLDELPGSASAAAGKRGKSARIRHRGITGDVNLCSEPNGEALGDIQVITSTRQGTIALSCRLDRSTAGRRRLHAVVSEGDRTVREFQSELFDAKAVQDSRFIFSSPWRDPKLWDIDTPGNMYSVAVGLYDADGRLLDQSLPVRFGFREFWIDGRDFYLNGKRLQLRALDCNNVTAAADQACLDGSRHTCRAMKEWGFNAAITGAYDFAPGTVSYLDGFFDAADETGLLTAYTLPHIKDFGYNLETPENRARYTALTEWLIRRAQNHPSIVFYAMNHNANGYYGDQNPLKIDGKYEPATTGAAKAWSTRNRKQSLAAAKIAETFDPTRVVYNHESGNLGSVHTANTYLNWAPIQERSDWLEHWAAEGVKPVFFVEYGLPHISSWSSFRGPAFIWTNPAFQCVWDSEFAAAYTGQRAYRMTPLKIRSLRHEEDLWAQSKPFPWYDLNQNLQHQEENYLEIQALFTSDIWRSLRTWGISAILPWDQGGLWAPNGPLTATVLPARSAAAYRDLQRPGIVPEVIETSPEMIYHRKTGELAPTSLGRAFLRWNQPIIAYIGGGDRFTSKGHNFLPGETVRKQLVVVNDSRAPVACRYTWKLEDGPGGAGEVNVGPGDRSLVPISLTVPEASGGVRQYVLSARFELGGKVQEDRFVLDVAPSGTAFRDQDGIALFDPKGLTAGLLKKLGIRFTLIEAGTSLEKYGLLVIGREAIRPQGALPDLSRVREGLKVLVFEQTHEALAERLGFRTNVHGIRTAFARVPGHPALQGLGESQLHDWRGAATLTPPYLDVPAAEAQDPTWRWLGFENTRVWRCGNHGNVASVLIEKPSVGNFLPIVDCGFDLQYSPLLEYVEGKGRILFCQLDVTGRTEDDPVAAAICRNLVDYLASATPVPPRPVVYAGGKQGEEVLTQLGVRFTRFSRQQPLGENVLLVAGPGAEFPDDVSAAVARGVSLVCLGLGEEDLKRVLPGRIVEARENAAPVQELPPGRVAVETRVTVPSLVEDFSTRALCGVSNAELHWRTVQLRLAALKPHGRGGNEAIDCFTIGRGTVVLCQAAPWMFDYVKQPYLRTSYRRNLLLVSRLLSNLGADRPSPLVELLREEASPKADRWLHSYYVQKPEAVDDPYRYYRW